MKYEELIPVANTHLGEEEAKAAYDVVMSNWVSSGPKVREFEKAFAEMVGAKFAIAANSGTAALHAVLAALGIGPGDEVILPTLTFISTANVVAYQGATPVLAECDPKTFNITADIIRSKLTDKTKAIIPVDMMGMPVDYEPILKLADEHGIAVVADSAESLGAIYKGCKVGSIAPVHIFSFFPNKNITTGEGGMVTTDDEALAKKISMLVNQGQDYRYHHVLLGYNYRMANVQGAIGFQQLKRLDSTIKEKQMLAERYDKELAGFVETPHVPDYVDQHAWYMYTISVDNRDEIVKRLEEMNIQTRLSFPPIHTQPIYEELYGCKESDLPISLGAWKRLINIPLWPGMGKRQDFVIQAIKEIMKK